MLKQSPRGYWYIDLDDSALDPSPKKCVGCIPDPDNSGCGLLHRDCPLHGTVGWPDEYRRVFNTPELAAPEIVAAVCSICGEPLVVFAAGADKQVCHRRHPGDPPNWEPKPLTLTERLAFYKESKRS
jgi:hypothetical protein